MPLSIYISSTYEDLRSYREHVYQALRTLRHDVIAMEDYVATDERPLDKCLQDVREADIYVGLLAWRYGYVPRNSNPSRLSITELEYREARKHDKPCFIFLVKDTAAWPFDQTDFFLNQNNRGTKIQSFRKALREEHLISFFESPDELALKVVAAVFRWQNKPSGPEDEETMNDRTGTRQPAFVRDKHRKLWAPGSVLRVRFLGGNPGLQTRVIRHARVWSAYANVEFTPSEDKSAEIRIAFEKHDGSWSYVGTQCLDVPATAPTMNLGFIEPDSTIEDIESFVLHEFGHVLGLLHEQANPNGVVPWDKGKVYKYYMSAPNYWSKESVDMQIFQAWPGDHFPHAKPFDPLSIMAHAFPAELTGGEQIFNRNTAISSGDKEFVNSLYPYR